MLEDKELMLLTYILLNMRRGGYFKGTLEEIANALKMPPGDVKKMLDELQRKNILSYAEVSNEEISENLSEIVTVIDKLVMGEDVSDKAWAQSVSTYTYNYSRRNSILNKVSHQLKTGAIDPHIVEELYRIEAFLTPYRRVLQEEIASAKRVIEKEGPSNISFSTMLALEKLVLKSFPLTRSSLGTLSAQDIESKVGANEGVALSKVVSSIYVVDPSLVEVLKKRLKKYLTTLREVAKNIPIEYRKYVAYSMISLRKDLALLDEIRKVAEVVFK